jgi:threonine dehydrogenase-like Zn-dependent dehydrogenase
VLRTGPGVTAHKEGDRVVLEPTISCGHCEHCLAGFHNLCSNGIFMGGPQAHGFFREYAIVPVHNATPVPDCLSDNQATLIEPVAVMAHMLDIIQIRVGDTVAITGAGPIGMLCASVARGCGASRVYICDRVPHRLELAKKMGAHVIAGTQATFIETILDETGGRGVDIVLEAAGSPETINTALKVARPGGTVVLIGLTSEISVPLDIHLAMGKELRLQTLKRSNHCAAKAIRLLETGIIPDAVITHTMPLEQTPKAFDMAANCTDGAGKIVIGFNG